MFELILQLDLPAALRLAAAGQIAVALLNLALVRIMGWKPDLDQLPLLIREVFYVHSWFISITLVLFGIFTWRFAIEMESNLACRWLAAGIAFFWFFRTLLQVGYYSSSHWRGQPGRTVIHGTLLIAYGALSAIYACAAFRPLLERLPLCLLY
ncbi:MAG: hypothetical protein AB1813_23365 [Verrucomicrobiota bacterium]|jgi:hypothetical protein